MGESTDVNFGDTANKVIAFSGQMVEFNATMACNSMENEGWIKGMNSMSNKPGKVEVTQ